MTDSLENLVGITECEPDQVLWVSESKEVLQTNDLGMVKSEFVDQDDHKNEPFNDVNINTEMAVHKPSDVAMEFDDKDTIIQSTEVNERDPLEIYQSCCHICEAEVPGLQFYGGICCYSCRAFFRRAAGSVVLCSTGENTCIITKATRTRCKKCRYQRCLDAGMKPDMVDRTLSAKISQEDQHKHTAQTPEYQSDQSSLQVNEKNEQLVEIKLETEVSEELNNIVGNLEEQTIQKYSKYEEKNIFDNDGKDGVLKIKTETGMCVKSSRIKKKKKRIPKNCPICEKEMKNVHSHIANVHSETLPENHTCNHCEKVFRKSENLRAHFNAVHKVQPATCDICSKEFKNLHSLRGHKSRVHESISRETCPSCFKIFDSKLRLYFHVRAVHTLEDSICQACGKTFKNKFLLQKHVSEYHRLANK